MGRIRTDVAETGTEVAEESRSRTRVSSKEEGVHQMSGESSGRPREPKQGPHRRAQVAQGTLL